MTVKKKYIKISLEDIYHIKDYRGYDTIWCYTPKLTAPELHMGYIDNEFFAYILSPYGSGIDIEQPTTVIDHYLDKIFLKCPSVEYNMMFMNEDCRPYLEALKSKKKMFEESVKVYNSAPNNQN